MDEKITKTKLKDVRLKMLGDKYYLDVKYNYESDKSEGEITVTDIRLPIVDNPTINHTISGRYSCDHYVDIGFGELKYYGKFEVQENKRRMTMNEIEKELGYKVEIIN